MVVFYFTSQSTVQTQTLFHERYPGSATPTRVLINRTIRNLREYGHFSVQMHAQARSRDTQKRSGHKSFGILVTTQKRVQKTQLQDLPRANFYLEAMKCSMVTSILLPKIQDIVLADYPRRVQFCR